MPYIKQIDRTMFDEAIENLVPETAGELNYVFTRISHEYFNRPKGGNYQAFNDIIGALEGAKLELYRRKVAPYEDTKIEENGDVG
jgi:hypothetical protein